MMSKTLISALGLIVSLGIVALAFFLVALPIFVQSLATDAETKTIQDSNAVYEAKVAQLTAEEENLDEINASVEELHGQIPSTAQFDGVFEVIARAATDSGVMLTNVTAGETAPYATRSEPVDGEDAASGIAPPPESNSSAEAPADGDPATEELAAAGPPSSGQPAARTQARQQANFVIQATALNMGEITAFLDGLREGPRLLNTVEVTALESGEGNISVQITALTYIDSEEVAQ